MSSTTARHRRSQVAPAAPLGPKYAAGGSGRARSRGAEEPGDFYDFVMRVGRIAVWPITYPFSLLTSLLSSPLTLSLLLRAALLLLLLAASGTMALIATATFWWSWGRAGVVEVDGWLVYGARGEGRPHAVVPLAGVKLAEETRYDVEVEMELVRPGRGEGSEGDNFMLTLEFLSDRTGNPLKTVSQPCLPASPYISSYLPSLPSLNPIAYLHRSPRARSRSRSKSRTLIQAHRDLPASAATQLLVRPMVAGAEGVVPRPGRHRGGERTIGALRVLVGREDARGGKEVRTTGWVVVRFTPRPTGIRWLLTAHPIPPLLILPPIALTLTISSALSAYLVLMCCFRSASRRPAGSSRRVGGSTAGSHSEKQRLSPETARAPPAPAPPAYQDVFAGRSLDDPQIALPPRARRDLEHDATVPGVPIPLASPGESDASSSGTSYELVGASEAGQGGAGRAKGVSASSSESTGGSHGEEDESSATWSSAGEGEETPVE